MTTEEAIAAFKAQVPVINKNGGYEIEYLYISALIYRLNQNKKMELSLELYDKCGHAVTITSPRMVRVKEEKTL